MDWMTSPFVLMLVGYVGLLALFFAVKLNRKNVVPIAHDTDGPVDAIQFFWRPG